VTVAVAPAYPPAASALAQGGDARIEVTVRGDGTVVEAKPIEGSLLLYDASIKAAKQWHFQPSGRGRKVILTFSFRPLVPDASVEDATAFFMPPYRVEVRKKMPPSTVNPGLQPE
jgi:TonB family protein